MGSTGHNLSKSKKKTTKTDLESGKNTLKVDKNAGAGEMKMQDGGLGGETDRRARIVIGTV